MRMLRTLTRNLCHTEREHVRASSINPSRQRSYADLMLMLATVEAPDENSLT
jgi:hypothetical protein